jgi:hypothetical protein
MAGNLRAYLRSLQWGSDEIPPVVPLDLFFKDNDEEDSIAPNQWEYGRPPIASLYSRFKEIAAFPEVSDVYVGLHSDWNYCDYGDSFPPAETVLIVTSAGRSQIESWLTGLEADGLMVDGLTASRKTPQTQWRGTKSIG